jgi:hypothetical protein
VCIYTTGRFAEERRAFLYELSEAAAVCSRFETSTSSCL